MSKDAYHIFFSQEVFDCQEKAVFIADLSTDKILFMNKNAKKFVGDRSGETLADVISEKLGGLKNYCDKKKLLDKQGNPGLEKNLFHQNTLSGDHFHVVEQAVHLADGRLARLTTVSNISDRDERIEAWKSKDDILSFQAQFAERLLLEEDWQTLASNFLKQLGQSHNLARVSLFKNSTSQGGEILTSLLLEWTAPDVEPERDNSDLQNLSYQMAGLLRLDEILAKGQAYYGVVSKLPSQEQPFFTALDAKSIAVTPIMVDMKCWGFLCFADNWLARQWSFQEIDTFKTAANTLSMAAANQLIADKLRKSKELYRAVVEDQTELICRYDKNGNLTFVNEAYCNYFAQNCQELTGKSFMPLIPEEDKILIERNIAALTPGKPVARMEHRAVLPSGEFRWQQWIYRAIYDERGHLLEYQGVGRDITDQKNTEQKLTQYHKDLKQEVEERTKELKEINEKLHFEIKIRKLKEIILKRYEQIVSASQEMMSFIDKEHIYKAANDAFLAAFNKKRQEIVGQSAERIFGKDVYEKIIKKRLEKCLKGEKIIFESWFDFGGTGRKYMEVSYYPFFDEDDTIAGIVNIARDITERRLAEEKIKQQNDFLQSIIESIPYPFFAVNADNYCVVSANSAAKEIGLSTEDECILKIWGEDDLGVNETLKTLHKKVIQTKKPQVDQYSFTAKGKACVYEIHGYPVPDSNGNVVQIIGAFIDISKRKELEDEKEELIEELQSALDKVKVLSGFLPICTNCKKIRDDKGYWNQLEAYIRKHSDAQFSHSICPDCAEKLYPDFDLYQEDS